MTDAMPIQEFQIGQRVRPNNKEPEFTINGIYLHQKPKRFKYSGSLFRWYLADELTLCPERPPYVPSERLVLGREPEHRFNGQFPQLYRCETDVELAARHAVERAEYDAQGDEA